MLEFCWNYQLVKFPPLKLINYEGKVVLVDFWTYTCDQLCIRTLPFVSWYEKYKTRGLLLLESLSSREFVKKYHLPSAYCVNGHTFWDNDYKTWVYVMVLATDYLIDANGKGRNTTFV